MKISLTKTIYSGLLIMVCFLSPVVAQEKIDASSSATSVQKYFDPQAATQEYLDSLTPQQKERSDAYFEGGYWIMLWEIVLEIAVAWIFLYLGLSAWMKRKVSGFKSTNIQNLVYALLYLIFAAAITFPFSVYTDFYREHQYGLSNLNFSGWFTEFMISLALSLILGGLLITILYRVMRKAVKSWWLLCSGVVIVFMVITMIITPVFISPLYNDYKPLEEGQVKEDVLSLARANGVPVHEVYQFNASKQTTNISANVSGFGNTIRISLNDNLLNKCTPAEIKSVMAHEMGHYVLNHIYKLLIYMSILVIIGFGLINWLMNRVISKHGHRWGITSPSDIKSLPLLVLFFSCYMFLISPVTNTITRTTESEADIFGLNAAGEPDGFAKVAMKLSDYRKINPGRLEEIIFFDHPSGKARVSMAMRWKAEHVNNK